MSQLLEFLVNHWMLFLALGVISGLLVHNVLHGNKGSVDALGAIELINRDGALVVDVRPTADFAQGHIINALNIPMNGFKNQIGTLQKYKDHTLVVSCRSGSQSTQACSHLRKEGFQKVFSLRGGILAWQAANLPLTRKRR